MCFSAGALLGGACGGTQSTDEIARGLNGAVRESKPRPTAQVPSSEARAISEEETESAAQRVICDGLRDYSSDPAQALSGYMAEAAERERLRGQFGLSEVDRQEAGRLAEAAGDVNDSQQASEVASELGCP